MAQKKSAILPDPWVCAGAFLAIFYLVSDNWGFLSSDLNRGQEIGRDFVNYWSAAHLAASGRAAEIFDPAAFGNAYRMLTGKALGFNTYPYPPTSLPFLLPLSLTPYDVGLVLWTLVTFGLCAYVLVRFTDHRKAALLVLALAPATAVNVSTGQNGFLSAALMCGGLLSVERRPILAGVCLGLLTFKPQLGLLIPLALLAGGYWRTIASATATLVALLVASFALFGAQPWVNYFDLDLPTQRAFAEHGSGIALLMAPTTFMSARVLGLATNTAYLLHAVVALPVAALCIYAFRRADLSSQRKFAILAVGTFLVSPYAFNYDMVVVTMAVFLAVGHGRTPVERAVIGVLYLLPILMIFAGAVSAPIGPLVLLSAFATLLRTPPRLFERQPEAALGASDCGLETSFSEAR